MYGGSIPLKGLDKGGKDKKVISLFYVILKSWPNIFLVAFTKSKTYFGRISKEIIKI